MHFKQTSPSLRISAVRKGMSLKIFEDDKLELFKIMSELSSVEGYWSFGLLLLIFLVTENSAQNSDWKKGKQKQLVSVWEDGQAYFSSLWTNLTTKLLCLLEESHFSTPALCGITCQEGSLSNAVAIWTWTCPVIAPMHMERNSERSWQVLSPVR